VFATVSDQCAGFRSEFFEDLVGVDYDETQFGISLERIE
jgi:hypothetical protein